MDLGLENALYQWEEGQRRIREADPGDQGRLDRAVLAVLDELRHRLGSSFLVSELVELYAQGTDWAEEVAVRNRAGFDAVAAVDAAFARYAREAADYAGGRQYVRRS